MSEKLRAIIDLLSSESFEREHLPGAVNFCVYETAFLEKVAVTFPDKATPLAVCGYCDDTREAEEAIRKLVEAGYEDVTIVEGGLREWKERGHPTEGAGGDSDVIDGLRAVDCESSFIRWTGRNALNFHAGDLKLRDGFVEVAGGSLVGAKFQIDMESIHCTDLVDSSLNRMLIDHLRTADFFDTARFPSAELEVITAAPLSGATHGMPDHRVEALLTLRGIRHALTFDATVAWKADGSCVAQAELNFDRTLWGSHYGSGKFFARLGQHVVNDLIHLHVKVATFPPS